ncbi:Disease resistance protein RUN1, partial [Linum perenne]
MSSTTQLVSGSMAVTSPPGAVSSPTSGRPLVFLSFRGSDTRKNFTDHLYNALTWTGFRTYRDENEIEGGEDIVEQISLAIKYSRMSLIVFSQNFASSSYCLDEVVNILECKRNKEHTVVPIFYNVSTDDVTEDNGTYDKAMRKICDDDETVSKWRKTIRDVAGLDGMVLGAGHEADFIKQIVKTVERTLKVPKQNVPSYVTGIESHIENINDWLSNHESNDVSIAVICGIGGVGKTTIANILLNINSNSFDAWSFIDIDNRALGKNRLDKLRSTLLHRLSNGRTREMEYAVCNKRVLVVLDGVVDIKQLDVILGDPQLFCKGSKIIVTTRHSDLLKKPYEASKTFEINGLEEDDALALFNLHAFIKLPPNQIYAGYSERIVRYCSGLPLALEVLGRGLYRKHIESWHAASQKPETIDGSNRVAETLKISYDLLDERDKMLFLDIACFFVDKDKDCVVQILQDSDCYRPLGIEDLVSKNLVSIGECNRLTMHQLIRDMGRQIVNLRSQQSIYDPGERSRLWKYKDVIWVLKEETGERVRSIILDPPRSDSELELQVELFAKMRNLKLLHLNNVKLYGNFKSFPKNLHWLSWQRFPLKHIPNDFPLDDLVVLELTNSKIKNFHNQARLLPNLKVLNLSDSCNLTETPEFSRLPNLEQLILRRCTSLVEIDDSIAGLGKLSLLDVSYSTSLTKLSLGNGYLKSLKELHVSGCPGLGERYSLDPCEMAVAVRNTTRPTSALVASLSRFLVSLSLWSSNTPGIPEDLSPLSSVKMLHIDADHLTSLPETIKTLQSLLCLSLSQCDKLESIPQLPSNVKSVMVIGCSSLKRITNLPHIHSDTGCNQVLLIALHCGQLVEVQGIFKLEPIPDTELDVLIQGFLQVVQSLYLELGPSCGTTLLYSRFTWVKMSFQRPQVLHEFGMWSVFLSAILIPDYSKRVAAAGANILLIDFPFEDGLLGLILIVLYRTVSTVSSGLSIAAEIINETKSLKWTYKPIVLGISEGSNNAMLWVSRWKLGHQVEMGNQLKVRVYGDEGVEILTTTVQFDFGFGIEDITSKTSFACRALSDLDLSPYQVMHDEYDLDNSLDRQLQRLLMQSYDQLELDNSGGGEIAGIGQVSRMLKAVQDVEVSGGRATIMNGDQNPQQMIST